MVVFTVLAWVFRSFEGLYAHAGLYWLFSAVLIGPVFYMMAFRRQLYDGIPTSTFETNPHPLIKMLPLKGGVFRLPQDGKG